MKNLHATHPVRCASRVSNVPGMRIAYISSPRQSLAPNFVRAPDPVSLCVAYLLASFKSVFGFLSDDRRLICLEEGSYLFWSMCWWSGLFQVVVVRRASQCGVSSVVGKVGSDLNRNRWNKR